MAALGPVAVRPNEGASILPEPVSTPSEGSGGPGSFTIACSVTIAAPPSVCLDVVRDAPGYSEWNGFIRTCRIIEQPPEVGADGDIGNIATKGPDYTIPKRGPSFLGLGTKFCGDYFLDPETPPDKSSSGTWKLEVSVLEVVDEEREGTRQRGFRIGWKTRGILRLGLRSERIVELLETGDGSAGTTYVTWETFYGVLAPPTRWSVSRSLLKGYDAWAGGLKRRAEQLAKGEMKDS